MVLSNIGTFLYSIWTYKNFLTNAKTISQIAQRLEHAQIIYEDNLESNNNFMVMEDST
jgi:hypothetical protein